MRCRRFAVGRELPTPLGSLPCFCEADGPRGRRSAFYFEDEPVGASGTAVAAEVWTRR
jgi:hypothetical protein